MATVITCCPVNENITMAIAYIKFTVELARRCIPMVTVTTALSIRSIPIYTIYSNSLKPLSIQSMSRSNLHGSILQLFSSQREEAPAYNH